MEHGYSKYRNPYHNLIHAADVLQTTYQIIYNSGLMVEVNTVSLSLSALQVVWRSQNNWTLPLVCLCFVCQHDQHRILFSPVTFIDEISLFEWLELAVGSRALRHVHCGNRSRFRTHRHIEQFPYSIEVNETLRRTWKARERENGIGASFTLDRMWLWFTTIEQFSKIITSVLLFGWCVSMITTSSQNSPRRSTSKRTMPCFAWRHTDCSSIETFDIWSSKWCWRQIWVLISPNWKRWRVFWGCRRSKTTSIARYTTTPSCDLLVLRKPRRWLSFFTVLILAIRANHGIFTKPGRNRWWRNSSRKERKRKN